ncbi:Nif3-like dinuclear metal center hexameric protein [Nocardioides sp. BP30]|uniref:Nif3-like dinuclear metal center hexameric protein n=1 Tax=Nocardioides sp. BP30 TaxID=3036374 RepID=UPI002469C35B|nr:Nif3-like dinuclear metal center hexameric protein [Nocardioides sp. BP30]WGL51058.1 Nif3-like dinuclear metal center hexameric protein [Nocardioides sp. BP30]
MSAPRLGDVVDLLHGWYPPETAAGWDAVGLVYGDPEAPCEKVLLAVDPVLPVAEEAAEWGAQLLVTHHPLFLKPVHGFAPTTPKGLTLWTLSTAGCGLLAAHTNADQAEAGVSEAMALALGLQDIRPLEPAPPGAGEQLDKLTTYVPTEHAERLRQALAGAGAGRLGDYDNASFSSAGEGRFRPLVGADPHTGSIGELSVVEEVRIEAILPRVRRRAVIEALLGAHPYEVPAYDVVELAPAAPAPTGFGRIGTLPAPMSLADFTAHVARNLPRTTAGVRAGGAGDRTIRTVALCGGAGDSLLGSVRSSGADVYVTSDLRHHLSSEFLEDGAALVDVPHWAAEWTWLPLVGGRLRAALGDRVEVRVSEIVTDPWTLRI